MSIARTAELAGCSIAQVKRVTALHRAKTGVASSTDTGPDDQSRPEVVASLASE